MVAALLPALPASAGTSQAGGKPGYHPPVYRGKLWSPRKLKPMPSVGGHALPADAGRLARARQRPPHEPGSVPAVPYRVPSRLWWPSGSGTAVLSQTVPVRVGRITGQVTRRLTGPQRAGELPLTITGLGASSAAVHVALASRRVSLASGISGPLFRVSGGTGRLLVRLNYAKFAKNYGGAWASRLKLVELPACALTTPQVRACRTPARVPGSNDGTHSIWATIQLGAPARPVVAPATGQTAPQFSARLGASPRFAVLAAVSTPAGAAGNYAATSLSPEGTWAVQQGNFNYDYPIVVPPSLGGSAPDVTLSYSSESIDGETSAQNPQGSQIGDGWTYSPGFIEQSYQPCTSDSSATTAEAGDECWDGYAATMSLGGHSGLLVGSGPGTWHLQNDDGTKIQLLTGGANSMWNGEYWLVTTTDGTKYYFGANHVPGSPTSSLVTNSAWSVPVYCPATADPCHSSTWTQMPYRWNLDYVVDPDNNLTVYNYATETNYYQRGGSAGGGTLTSYIRGGYLTSVLYGWQLKDATASPAVSAADKIVFNASARCLASSCTTVTSAAYPDVPTDQICASGATNCLNASPTFFSEKRLTSISTYVLVSQASGTYNLADSYALNQQFDTGTGETTAVMALTSITRTTGETGTPPTPLIPATQFTVTMMNNRVAGTTQPALYRPRISQLTTEAGATISVDYNPPQCTQGTGGNITNADAPINTKACFPGFWAPPNDPNSMDWFDYYTVSQVEVSDASGAGSVPHVTDYTYPSSGVAWHYDESLAESSKYRTWDEYRGFLSVEATNGQAPDPVTETVTYYLRGMDGDNNGSGGTKSVHVSDTIGDSYVDSNSLADQPLETDTYSQAGGQVETEKIGGPWTFNSTASMTPPSGSGLSVISSFMLAQSQVRTRRLLASGSWQTSASTSYFNGSGLVTAVDNAPAGLTETCTSTSYATAPSGNPMMLGYPDEVQEVSGAYSTTTKTCPAVTGRSLLSDKQTYYDDQTASISSNGTASLGTLGHLASPGGIATGTQAATGWSAGAEVWQPLTADQTDQYGRETTSYDADGNKSTTGYTPATQALPTSIVKKNALGWATTTALSQTRQLPVSITDPNGAVTTEAYDPLGRLTSVTLPLDQGIAATYKYSYSVTGTSPTAVTTQTLRDDGSYSANVKIYDGMLQQIEEQTTTASNAAGRLVSYATWNSEGWKATITTRPFYDSTAGPSGSFFIPNADEIPAQTVNSYDGQGRITTSAFYSLGVPQWQSVTSYSGMDQTNVTPPAGGTATATVTNSLGETAKSMQYTDSSGDADTTSYTYTPLGQVASVADNNGNTWSYTYDLLGHELTATDPGATAGPGSTQPGTTSYVYDPVGNMVQSTDPNGTVLTYKYDALGRKIDEYNDTSGTPVVVGSWVYDKTPLNGGSSDALGYMSSGTSYDSSGAADTESITGYNTAYEPTGTATSIPSDQGALATGTSSNQYTTSTAYTPRTGLAEYTAYSADGGLPAETVQNTYDEAGLLTQFGDSSDYLDNVSYDPLGQVLSTTFGPYGSQLVQDYAYDAGTSRTLQSVTSLQTLSSAADTTSYTYDPSGNITSASDAQNTGGTQTQCYSYNKLDQLTTAWTDTAGTSTAGSQTAGGIGACASTSPAAGNIGGPAPYWESYTYDLLGDRTSETTYNTALPASQDTPANATTQQIQYPGGNLTNSPSSNAPATAQPQADTAASIVTASPSGTTTTTPTYNAAGQLTSQNVTKTGGGAPPAGPPSLSNVTYNPQGQVASVTTSSGTTNYTYDSSGNLLIQASPAITTLYVDGGAEEISLRGGALSGVRLLPAPDGVAVAETSSGTVSYEVANQQGTATESIQAGSLAITRRYFDPWGQQIGTPPAWPDSDAFLGKPQDPNGGLVVLGARAYDPVTGSFTSLDPLLEAGSPQQMGGYGYAGDNPVTNSDPSGKCTGPYCNSEAEWCVMMYGPAACGMGGGGGNSTGGSSGSSGAGSSGGDSSGGGDAGPGGFWGIINQALNLKADLRDWEAKQTFYISGVGTVTIDVKVSLEGGAGDSILTYTLDKELKGDAEIHVPGLELPVSVPVNVLPLTKEAAEEESCANKCSLTGESKTVTLDGVPYNVSEKFGLLSITFDMSTEQPLKIAGTEVGGLNVDASITIQRQPNIRNSPPPGGPVGSLQMNENHATNWIPVPSWQQIQTATASNSGGATALAILSALAGGALYAWHRLRGGQGILEFGFS